MIRVRVNSILRPFPLLAASRSGLDSKKQTETGRRPGIPAASAGDMGRDVFQEEAISHCQASLRNNQAHANAALPCGHTYDDSSRIDLALDCFAMKADATYQNSLGSHPENSTARSHRQFGLSLLDQCLKGSNQPAAA